MMIKIIAITGILVKKHSIRSSNT